MNKHFYCAALLLLLYSSAMTQPFQFFDRPQGFGGIALLDNTQPVKSTHQLRMAGALLHGIQNFQTFRLSYHYQQPKMTAAMAYQVLKNSETQHQWMQMGLSRLLSENLKLYAVFHFNRQQTTRFQPQETFGADIGLAFTTGAFEFLGWTSRFMQSDFGYTKPNSGLQISYATQEQRLVLQSSAQFFDNNSFEYSSNATFKLTGQWNIFLGYTFSIKSVFWGFGYQHSTYGINIAVDKHPTLGFTPKTLLYYAF